MSGELTNKLNENLGPQNAMSQASVVMFLNELANYGIVEALPVTKKDGKLSRYSAYRCLYTEEELWRYVKELALNWISRGHDCSVETKTEKGI